MFEVKRSKKCYVLIRKRYIKGEKHIAPMDFAEYLRKSDVSETAKFIMADFYDMQVWQETFEEERVGGGAQRVWKPIPHSGWRKLWNLQALKQL